MSTSIDNFTVTEVNEAVASGDSISATLLTLSPNTGYSITASAFTATITSPVNSISFVQDGANVLMLVGFDGTEISGDLSVPICMSGSSSTVVISLQVDYTHNLQNATASLAPTTINISGPYNTTNNVFTSAFPADTGFYFLNTPTCSVTVGDNNNYTITNTKTFDSNNNLIAISFSADYTFPLTSVTGDEIKVTASAIALPDAAPVLIRSYIFSSKPLSTSGTMRRFTATGTPGAPWNLTVNDGTSNIYDYNSIIPSGGQDFIDITIPAGFDVDYVFTLSGNLINPFLQVNPFTLSQSGDIATLSTSLATNVTSSTATSGGSAIITNDTVTEKGVEWSTTSNFSTIIGATLEGGTNANFTSNITGLSPSTNYFIRAYATNNAGTGYGQVLQFATGPVLIAFTHGAAVTSSNTACASIDIEASFFYFAQNTISEGVTVYTDAGLSTIFVGASTAGNDIWYRQDSGGTISTSKRALQIDSSGEIINQMALCV